MNRDAIDWAREMLLAADPQDLSPRAVLFLLRIYVREGGEAVRTSVEHGLTHGLAAVASDPDIPGRLAWLRVLAEAASLSDDERLRESVGVALPAAVDGLETLVRRSYEPGEGLLDRSCSEHLQVAAALLAAFDLSGRVPYAMLAEELMQHARRWWRAADGAFDAVFQANCTALHVLCRLAALHADADYRAAAVVAPTSTYPDDARCLAAWINRGSGEHPHDAAEMGASLLEWFALESNLQ